ncbi:MAG: CsgG/HfaB family protein [Elusimicrobiota bacterium]
MKRLILLISLLISTIGCSLRTSYVRINDPLPPKPATHKIEILAEVPRNRKYIEIGTIATHDTGFTTAGSRTQSLQRLMIEARKLGGDAVFITQETLPDAFSSTCWRHEGIIIAYTDVKKRDNPTAKEVKSMPMNKREIYIALLELSPKNISKSDASILTDKLRVELYYTGNFQLLEREKMDNILKEQSFQKTGCTDTEYAVQIGKLVGVEQMIIGEIGLIENVYLLTLRRIDVETGKVVSSVYEETEGTLKDVLQNAIPSGAIKICNE